jgi:uncharacterized protein (TIGR03435 family)
MRYVVCTLIALICTNLRAQTPPARPQFEVASVKPAANDEKGGGRPPRMREMMRKNRQPGFIPLCPGRVRIEDWALLDLIAAAYSVRANQVSGPAWMSDQAFDIEAKVPAGAPKEAVNAMLQSLLEDRFGLSVHRDTQTKQGFALVVGKNGPKLKPAEPPAVPTEGLTEEERKAKASEQAQANRAAMMSRIQEMRESVGPGPGAISRSRNDSITTAELASQLAGLAEAPVVDETGLTGKYSVVIETWTNADVPGGTVFDAVEKLGLKLEPRKVTVETVVVDQVSKTPTAN